MKMSNSVTLETTAKACIVVDVGSDITSSHSGPTKGLAATLTSLAIEEVGEGKEDPKMMMMKMVSTCDAHWSLDWTMSGLTGGEGRGGRGYLGNCIFFVGKRFNALLTHAYC